MTDMSDTLRRQAALLREMDMAAVGGPIPSPFRRLTPEELAGVIPLTRDEIMARWRRGRAEADAARAASRGIARRPFREPRYDEVYAEGVAWLDSLAREDGDP